MPATRSSTTVVRTLARLRRTLAAIEATGGHHEVTQRARAQAVLDDLAAIPAAILIADNRGHYVDVNAAAARLTGYTRAELLRLSVWDLTPDTDQVVGRRLWRDFLERGRLRGAYRLQHKSGRTVSTQYYAFAHVLPGVHVSAIVRRPATRRRAGASAKRRVRTSSRR